MEKVRVRLVQLDYDLWGKRTQLSGTFSPDFGYAGYFEHGASGLNLTLCRGYSPANGIWISRDPSGEMGGQNLYGYVGGQPSGRTDIFGLCSSPFAPTINGDGSLTYHDWMGNQTFSLSPESQEKLLETTGQAAAAYYGGEAIWGAFGDIGFWSMLKAGIGADAYVTFMRGLLGQDVGAQHRAIGSLAGLATELYAHESSETIANWASSIWAAASDLNSWMKNRSQDNSNSPTSGGTSGAVCPVENP